MHEFYVESKGNRFLQILRRFVIDRKTSRNSKHSFPCIFYVGSCSIK